MKYADPDLTWVEWSTANADVDMPEADRLAALREYIAQTARTHYSQSDFGADWGDKKLAKLGVPDRLRSTNNYVLRAPATGALTMTVTARSRAEALDEFARRVADVRVQQITEAFVSTGAVAFVSGPEDPDPTVVDPEIPTTVADTLAVLREIILLGNIAGPRFNCETGCNHVLASYGLDPIPPRKRFVVSRPVEAEMRTTVEAYDEASAERVARWRWEDGRTGYETVNADPVDELSVTVA